MKLRTSNSTSQCVAVPLRTPVVTIPTHQRVATVLLCVDDWCLTGFDQFTAAAAAAAASDDDGDDDDQVMIVDGKLQSSSV